MPRQRQLQQDPAHIGIVIQPREQRSNLPDGGLRGEPLVERPHPHLRAGPLLVGHVDGGAGVVADEHGREAGGPSGLSGEGLDLRGDLLAD